MAEVTVRTAIYDALGEARDMIEAKEVFKLDTQTGDVEILTSSMKVVALGKRSDLTYEFKPLDWFKSSEKEK